MFVNRVELVITATILTIGTVVMLLLIFTGM
jgi:hypothetical protein